MVAAPQNRRSPGRLANLSKSVPFKYRLLIDTVPRRYLLIPVWLDGGAAWKIQQNPPPRDSVIPKSGMNKLFKFMRLQLVIRKFRPGTQSGKSAAGLTGIIAIRD
jgi:hypothetical protein